MNTSEAPSRATRSGTTSAAGHPKPGGGHSFEGCVLIASGIAPAGGDGVRGIATDSSASMAKPAKANAMTIPSTILRRTSVTALPTCQSAQSCLLAMRVKVQTDRVSEAH